MTIRAVRAELGEERFAGQDVAVLTLPEQILATMRQLGRCPSVQRICEKGGIIVRNEADRSRLQSAIVELVEQRKVLIRTGGLMLPENEPDGRWR